MRPLKTLTFDAFRDDLATAFAQIEDTRDQRRMKERTGQSNLERVFRVAAIPSDTQMREILDGVPTDPLRRVLPQTFEQMRRIGWTGRFVTEVAGQKYYP